MEISNNHINFFEWNYSFDGHIWEKKLITSRRGRLCSLLSIHSMHIASFRLLESPSFQLANSLYDQSFSEILEFKDIDPTPTTLRKYDMFTNRSLHIFSRYRFTETLVEIQRRHANIVPILARVILLEENVRQTFASEISRPIWKWMPVERLI